MEETELERFKRLMREARQRRVGEGVALVGGTYGGGDWMVGYYKGAQELARLAEETHRLDELGLPVVYLQRHVVELLLKGVISQCAHVDMLRRELACIEGKTLPGVPLEEPPNWHRLDALRDHAVKYLLAIGASPLAPCVNEMVAALQAVGDHDGTRWRYASVVDKSQPGKKATTPSFEDSAPVPVRAFQQKLDEVFAAVYGTISNMADSGSTLAEVGLEAEALIQRYLAATMPKIDVGPPKGLLPGG